MYSSRKPVVKSDDDSDLESRYRSTFSKDSSRSYNFPSSARNSIGRDSRDIRETRDSRDFRDSRDLRDRDSRDNDRYESNRYGNYRTNTTSRFQSDSDDDKPNTRYGSNTRRVARRSSDSSDSDDKNDKFRKSLSLKSTRPTTSLRRKDDDFDSYENANQKLKEMIQYDKSLCEQLDDIYDSKAAKEKKIEQLKEEIHRDTIKEENLRKKLSELRMQKKLLQSKLDEYK